MAWQTPLGGVRKRTVVVKPLHKHEGKEPTEADEVRGLTCS